MSVVGNYVLQYMLLDPLRKANQLSPFQLVVLLYLGVEGYDASSEGISQTNTAKNLGIDQCLISMAATSLEDKGFVNRDDPKEWYKPGRLPKMLTLTEDGSRLYF